MIKERSIGLDLIRAIAILLVLFSHSVFMTFSGVPIGIIGVEIFFVLSGFLIGQILIKNFMIAISIRSLFRFWVRRWMRTLPIYYLIILFKFFIIDSTLGYKIIVYFFFLQNNFVGVDFYAVSWSLVIEEWFYLVLPIGLFIFFKNGISHRKEIFIIFLVSIILIINIARIVWVVVANRTWGGILGNFPFRLDSLLTGVLAAAVKKLYPLFYKNFWLNKYCFLSGFLLFLIMITTFGYSLFQLKIDIQIWTRTIWFFLLSFSFALMIPFVDYSFPLKTGFFGKVITWISLISYSLYLIHPLVYHYVPKTGNALYDFFIRNGILFVICSITYLYFEKPIMNLREKIKI